MAKIAQRAAKIMPYVTNHEPRQVLWVALCPSFLQWTKIQKLMLLQPKDWWWQNSALPASVNSPALSFLFRIWARSTPAGWEVEQTLWEKCIWQQNNSLLLGVEEGYNENQRECQRNQFLSAAIMGLQAFLGVFTAGQSLCDGIEWNGMIHVCQPSFVESIYNLAPNRHWQSIDALGQVTLRLKHPSNVCNPVSDLRRNKQCLHNPSQTKPTHQQQTNSPTTDLTLNHVAQVLS